MSNDPIPEPSKNDDDHKPGSIQFDFDPSNVDPQSTSTKRGRGRPRKDIPSGPSNKAQPKRGRGRPRKSQPPADALCNTLNTTSKVGTLCFPKCPISTSSSEPKCGRPRKRKDPPIEPSDEQLSTKVPN